MAILNINIFCCIIAYKSWKIAIVYINVINNSGQIHYCIQNCTFQECIKFVNVNGKTIPFSLHVEHVGVLQSPQGNTPSLSRFTADRRALAGVLQEGMAPGHRGNPCFSPKLAT